MKRAVLFDVGDTLILGHPKYWLIPLLTERGLLGRARLDLLASAMREAYAHYADQHMDANTEDKAHAFWRQFHWEVLNGIGLGEHADDIALYLRSNWRSPQVWPLAPYTHEVLAEVKRRGYKMGVVSNWDWTLPGVLEATGLTPYFDYIGVSALEGVAKPDPRFFEIVLGKLDVEPQEAIHIGDSPDDINGAAAAGVEAILFDPYYQNPAALQDLRGLLERI